MVFNPHSKTVEDYRSIASPKTIEEIYNIAEGLQNEHIVMINSTPAGGGVAEILNSLVVLLNTLGVKTGWRILKGPDNFFQITKNFHNASQGGSIKLNKRITNLYQQVNYNNAISNHIDNHDLVVVHDPQPLPIINFYKKRIPWIWRFHPDFSHPNKKLLAFLKPFIEKYDAMIVSAPQYKQPSLKIKQLIFAPSIDPLTDKNIYLSKAINKKILQKQGVKLDKPILAQISRFDKWKDPLGVIDVFEQVRKKVNCRLVLMGNLAADDPEGPEIYRTVMKRANNNSDIVILLNCPDNDRTVNALQTESAVVLQKSLKEGFALTVSEALWKGTPVVGTKVGGIPLQIIHNKTGLLVANKKQTIDSCVKLLKNKKIRNILGKQGREHVRNNFLITRHLLDYLRLFDYYLNIQHRFNIGHQYPHQKNRLLNKETLNNEKNPLQQIDPR